MSKKEKKEVVDLESLPKKLVIYTDGGCHQKIGVGGWGFHGYLYVDADPKRGTGCPGHYPSPVGYTPNKNDREQKVTILKYVDGNGSITYEATNNVAELEACIRAMEIALKSNVVKVRFMLDSKYVLQGIQEWLPKWKANDWKRNGSEEVANRRHWERLDALLARMAEQNIETEYAWIKGHSGEPGNTRADAEASRGLIVGQKRLNHIHTVWSDPTGYWNIKAEYSRMFGATRHIFMNDIGETTQNQMGYYPYYLFDPPSGWEDDLFGLLDPNSSHSVVYLKERDPVIEMVKRQQEKLGRGRHASVVVLRLDTLFRPKVYNDVDANGDLYLFTSKRRGDLLTVDKMPLTVEINPPKLAFVGVQSMERLEGILQEFLEKGDKGDLVTTDITPIIYEEKSSGKQTEYKIRKEFDVSVKHTDLEVDVPYKGKVEKRKIRFIFGVDLPKRNVLAAVSSLNPKLTIVSWKQTSSVFHVATVLQTDEGVGIWTNVHTNFRFG